MVIKRDGKPLFPLGMYERPRDDTEWSAWAEAGINLVCCSNREQLDMAQAHGMFAWIPVPMIVTSDEEEEKLRSIVENLKDHPAIVVWEAPDEAIWRTIYFGDERARRLWREPEDRVVEVKRRREELVAGIARGSALIRELDPMRQLWLNEAMGCDFSTLARCLPYLDIIGGDHYPVPASEVSALNVWGPMLDRFRKTGPRHELWPVHQAFSWSNLPPFDPKWKEAYPTEEQSRFVVWQTIMHGATGILWWGSRFEDRPAPFLDGIMQVASEISQLHPFLTTGASHEIHVHVEEQVQPKILGVSAAAYEADGRTMLAVVCEDPRGHEITLGGFELDPNEMRQVIPESEPFVRVHDGWRTHLDGYEVRVYVSE